MTQPNAPLKAPSRVHAPHGAAWFELEWPDDARRVRLPNSVLRGYCPCAVCQGHAGPVRYQSGANTELREIEPVGSYGLRLVWGDGHGSGIFTFAYLWRLCRLFEQHGERLPEQWPELPREEA